LKIKYPGKGQKVRRLIGPILILLLIAEITFAVAIVMAQPGGFASLVDVRALSFGPERRQDIAPRTLPLNGQATNITISSMAGLVEVTGDPSLKDLTVTGTKIVHGMKESDFDNISFSVVQDGNTIRIEAKEVNKSFNFGFGEKMLIRVALPPALINQFTSTVGSADIDIKNLSNEKTTFVFTTGSGKITGTDVQASKITARVGSGDIRLTGFLGSLTANTGSGNIYLNGQNRLNDLNLETGSGDIRVGAQFNTNNSFIKTGSGDVHLIPDPNKVPGFDINTGSGNIDFKLANSQVVSKEEHGLRTGGSPVISIKTGSGDVTVE
jgi:DUF4097 and DUF4098 domain-containing protein YvlB